MTSSSRTLIAHLAQHIGHDAARKRSLRDHLSQATGRCLHRSYLHRCLAAQREPGLDIVIPLLRWMQLQGLIVPCPKKRGLFAYTRRLKNTAKAAKKSTTSDR